MNDLKHIELKSGEFWREIPGYKNIDEKTFEDFNFQLRNSVTSIAMVEQLIKGLPIDPSFIEDLKKSQKLVPMNIRITPYIFSLINWSDPTNDPLRRMFLPIHSQLILEDHPMHRADSLAEDEDSPVPYLTHRYHDKALFLALAICPTYCSYCTRSRLVGGTTASVEKKTANYAPKAGKWDKTFEYIKNTPALEDIVVSGGDTSLLSAEDIKLIGKTLFDIPHIRRIRFATKTLAVNPMKLISDEAWFSAIREVRDYGAKLGKAVAIHTHSSHPNELTEITKKAMQRAFSEQLIVRNQAVMLSGVNNSEETLKLLVKRLSYLNIQPYYVYQHDMVPGCEHLRTSLAQTIKLEKAVRGTTAGYNTPNFVCDLPGGGGKRHVATYEKYDELTGVSVWKAPAVKEKLFYYFDPLHSLTREGQEIWKRESPDEIIKRVTLQ